MVVVVRLAKILQTVSLLMAKVMLCLGGEAATVAADSSAATAPLSLDTQLARERELIKRGKGEEQ